MINSVKASQQDDSVNKNEKETTIQNSTVKYREDTLGYHEVINQVDQEYYHKIQGCSVKEQQQFI